MNTWLAIVKSAESKDLLWGTLVASFLAFAGMVSVALINRGSRQEVRDTSDKVEETRKLTQTAAEEVAQKILKALDTGNGHSNGQATAKIEQAMVRVEDKVDLIEVRSTEDHDLLVQHLTEYEESHKDWHLMREWLVLEIESRKREEEQ